MLEEPPYVFVLSVSGCEDVVAKRPGELRVLTITATDVGDTGIGQRHEVASGLRRANQETWHDFLNSKETAIAT